MISEIISGKAPITPETALQFERVLGTPAQDWLVLESEYRLEMAKLQEEQQLQRLCNWISQFPVAEMVKVGLLQRKLTTAEQAMELLRFFGVAGVDAWNERYAKQRVRFHHSPSFVSTPAAVSAWLRWGEIKADEISCADYNDSTFRVNLREIRPITRYKLSAFLPRLRNLCAGAGVAVVLTPGFQGTKLSGAAYWLRKNKAVIQLSLRHKSNDHFWFTFFHEAVHILLHSKKDVFVDDQDSKHDNAIEMEANRVSEDILIPRIVWQRFVQNHRFSESTVLRLSDELDVAPGIVVGRLQHEKLIPFSMLNSLKSYFNWQSDQM